MQERLPLAIPIDGPRRRTVVLHAAGFGLLYFLLALAGSDLSFQRGDIYVSFWMPAGLFAAALLLAPRKDWPLFILAACVSNLVFDLGQNTPLSVALCFCLANTLQTTLGVLLLRRCVSLRSPMANLRVFLGFLILVAFLSPIFGAAIGAGALYHAGLAPEFFTACRIWWGSNAMAILLFSPLVLSWAQPKPDLPKANRLLRKTEAAILIVGLVFTTWYLLAGSSQIDSPFDARLLPFLLWAGLRFGTRGASATCALLAVMMTYLLASGYTHVDAEGLMHSSLVFYWQIFLTVNALVGLIPAIVIEERDRTYSALRQSELRFRRLTEAAFEGLCIIDKGILTEVNEQLLAMNGFARDEMVGQHCTNFIAPESRAQVAAAFESGQETIGEHLLLRKDGSRFYAEARTRNVWAGSRKLRLMAIRDISERKQSENAVRRMNAELEERVQARTAELSEANRELEAFSYSVSHDLRAPLRHITGFAEMLKDSAAPLNAEATRQLERITGAVKRMTAIVEGLLTLTHSGRTELRQAPLKLGALIDEVREQLAPEMQERQIEWVIEPLPTVHADAGLLREAVSNLIHNALKYTSKRDVAHIHIGSTSEPARPDEVVVFIRDNGAGFDMRFVHKLFGICQRLHTDAEFEGTGIGLANVQRIIQRHGGRVWAEGQLNEGATFYFSLKRAKAK